MRRKRRWKAQRKLSRKRWRRLRSRFRSWRSRTKRRRRFSFAGSELRPLCLAEIWILYAKCPCEKPTHSQGCQQQGNHWLATTTLFVAGVSDNLAVFMGGGGGVWGVTWLRTSSKCPMPVPVPPPPYFVFSSLVCGYLVETLLHR